MALVAAGRTAEAEAQLTLLGPPRCGCTHFADPSLSTPPCAWDSATQCLSHRTLSARIALATGDGSAALRLLQLALGYEGNLCYDKPQPWFTPIRHCLGAVQLSQGSPAAARQTFLEDLSVWPRNPWSLRGMASAMQAMPNRYSRKQIEAALADAVAAAPLDGTSRPQPQTACPSFGL